MGLELAVRPVLVGVSDAGVGELGGAAQGVGDVVLPDTATVFVDDDPVDHGVTHG